MKGFARKSLSVILSLLFVAGIIGVGINDGVHNTLSIKANAYNTGDDYPSKYKNYAIDTVIDDYNFWNRECTSFAAWCLNTRNGIAFHNRYGGVHFGDAGNWVNAAQSIGVVVNQTPAVGSIACWLGSPGHVAWVKEINPNGTVNIEEYNYLSRGNYNVRNNITAPYYIHFKDLSNHNPIGAFDIAEGKTGQVFVRGWAFDPDSPNSSIDVHVYIGGPNHSTGEGHAITANYSRPDVNNAYGITGDHGFSHDIVTAKSGTQTVYVFAINTGEGGNICIASKTVTIAADTETPVISDAKITDVDKDGYTVTCKVTDNVIVNKVTFPTWTSDNGQDDLIWYNANISGDTASFRVLKSKHNNEDGEYRTDIYAQDYAGNYAQVRSLFIDLSTYTLTYNSNGGSTPPASQTGNGNITLSNTKPTRSGYTFLGWATSKSAIVAQYQPGASYSLTGNTTLYAVWQKNETPPVVQDPTIKIKNYTANKSVDYKATVTFTAIMTDAPAGAEVHWFIDGKDVHTSEKYTKDKATASYTVQCKLMQGNTVLAESEVENVQVNTGFFAKLIAFFRGLFGSLPIITQTIKETL